jgi:signal transduction histidine kinase
MDFEEVDKEARVIYGELSDQYQMIIGESTDEQDDVLELLLLAIIAVFILSLPIALLLVWGITRRSIAGIKRVSETALQLKRGNLSRRVNAVNEAEEVQTLADTFDSMADRIQQLISDMREMTDNIAHDLRTPISRIRLLSESMLSASDDVAQYQENADLTVRECDRLIDLINISLDVSETEAGISLDREKTFDIVEVVEDACELYDALAEEKAVRISQLLVERCDIRGDVHSIQRMVANLFDNAVKYSDQGGLISVLMKIEDAQVHITISNSGTVICESEFPKIFNRYYRIDSSRSGDGRGLGLSYARAVAKLHGGDILVKSDRISRVNTFTVVLACELSS